MPSYGLIFFSSLSVLAFEIILIRLFSIRFSYHYASLAISISMIGLVLGGIYTYFKSSTPRTPALVFILSLSYPLVFIFSVLLPLDHMRMLWEDIQIFYLFLFIILLAIPFFLYGVIISSLLYAHPQKVNRIYAVDLLGATGGVCLAILLLNYLKLEYIIATLSLILAGILILQCLFRKRNAVILFLIIPVALSASLLSGMFPVTISPYKSLSQALMDDGARLYKTIKTSHSQLDIFENPRMRLAPGLSLAYMREIPKGLGLAIDGDVTGVILDEKNIYRYDFLTYMPSALPYLIKDRIDNVFMVGFKSSIDVLTPYYRGARNVYVAEKDRSILRYIKDTFGSESLYTSSIYNKTGRTFATCIQEPFDIIFLSKTGFFPSGNFGLHEDYDTTIEAIHLYLSRLKEDGLLFIHMFLLSPPRYELRMMNNIIATLKKYGIHDLSKHLVVFRSWDTISFLIKKAGFTDEEQTRIESFTKTRQFDIIYPAQGRQEQFITGVNYKGIFAQLIDKTTHKAFVQNYPFNIETTTDDRPFFNYFLKLKKIQRIYDETGRKWAFFLHEGMALPFVLLFLILLSACIFLITICISKRQRSPIANHQSLFTPLLFCYFASIGLAFMFIEVFFIHKMMLPFGSPIDAFAVVLLTMLLSTGAGSLASGYVHNKKIGYYMGALLVLIIFSILFFERIVTNYLSFLAIIPIGICLGFYFPSGIKFLCKEEKGFIPLAYAINGVFSIIAPPLASLIAVAYGCTILPVLSCILYGFSLLLLGFAHHGYKGNTA